ncbi:MAG: hypothetical protein ABIG95_03000 [Candidatus Woesearchaeota archaeon]
MTGISRMTEIGGFREHRQNIQEATNRGAVDRDFRHNLIGHKEWID